MFHILLLSAALAARVIVPIPLIQGHDHYSPLAGSSVTTRGVVTSTRADGFYLQDPVGDGDDATSDAVFVYTGSPPAVVTGDDVEVDGTVVEYLPGGDPENLTVTELQAPQVRVVARGRPLPLPVMVGGTGRKPPTAVMDDDALQRYEPAHDGIDFWESLEGMSVRLAAPVVCGATNDFGECWVTAAGTSPGVGPRGVPVAGNGTAHPERVQLDDELLAVRMPAFDAGTGLDDVTGVIDYRFGSFELLPARLPTVRSPAPALETSTLPRDDGLVVASFNVHNLAPHDGERMERLGQIIAQRLGAPDIVVLQEIQDASGSRNDGETDATATLDSLRAAIRRAGGPDYQARDIAPSDNADGGAPGANIRVAILSDPAAVAVVTRGTPAPGAETVPVAGENGVALSVSPGRVAPADPAWTGSRKPLAIEFLAGETRLFVIGCHFASKLGATPDFGAIQPPVDPRAPQRREQARVVARFVEDLLRIDPHARVIVAGDFNDDRFGASLAPLAASPHLYDVYWRLAPGERYSFIYQGQGHAYDRILVSPALAGGAHADVVHLAAGVTDGPGDHDPVLAQLRLHTPSAPLSRLVIRPNPSGGAVTLNVAGHAGRLDATIFDVHGARIRRLISEDGVVTWTGNDDAGRRVAAGVYVVRVRAGSAHFAGKLVRVQTR